MNIAHLYTNCCRYSFIKIVRPYNQYIIRNLTKYTVESNICVRWSTYEKKSARAQTIPFERIVLYLSIIHRKEKKKKNTRCREITNYKCMFTCTQRPLYFTFFFFLFISMFLYSKFFIILHWKASRKKIKSEGILNEFTTEIAFCYSIFLTFSHFIFVYLKINFCVDFTFKNTLRKLIFVSV